MSTVFGFGAATIDFRINTADFGAKYTDKLLAQKTNVFGGGAIANCLVQVSKLGNQAVYLGKLGNDWIGKEIIKQLSNEGVDCNSIIIDKNLCSPFNVAIYAGENRIRRGGYLLPNSLLDINEKDINELCVNITKDDFVIVEVGEIPLEILYLFCKRINNLEAKLIIDVDLDPINQCGGNLELVNKIFDTADILIPNQIAIKKMYNIEDSEALIKKISKQYNVTTIITVGEKGCYYCTPNCIPNYYEALEVKVIDTVGAGDAFHGGLLYALANGYSIDDALKLAIKCGALNCTRFGAREGMISEVK